MRSNTEKMLSGQKGITMTELLVTISIITILASVGVASFFNSLPRYRLNATTRDLVSDLRLARQQAATENWQYAVQFLSTTSYNVVRGDQPLIQSSTSFSTIKSVNAQTSVSWSMPAAMPLLQPNGLIARWVPSGNSVTAGAPDSIVLTDPHTDTKTVIISAGGRIHIQ